MSFVRGINLLTSLVQATSNVNNSVLFKSVVRRSSPLFLAKLSSCCSPEDLIDANKYEKLSEETLELLSQKFEELFEDDANLVESDIELSNGVLTVKIANNGTYVINKQTPNRQIWLSSPISGPKRYDWVDDKWIYKRDQVSLQQLLKQEISQLTDNQISFDNLDELKRLK